MPEELVSPVGCRGQDAREEAPALTRGILTEKFSMKVFYSALSVIALAAVASGCQAVCNEATDLQKNLKLLDGYLAAQSGTVFCPLAPDFEKLLRNSAEKADKGARRRLSYTERVCLKSHRVRHCEVGLSPGGPPSHPIRTCAWIEVCDEAISIFHKQNGYDEVVDLAKTLREVEAQLYEGCYAYENGFTDEGAKKLVSARDNLALASLADDFAKVREVGSCKK